MVTAACFSLKSAKHFQAFPLATVWAEGMDDSQGVMWVAL